MQATVLESRPLYGIGTVARPTGLKPDTLRVWERRYGLGASQKSSTGRRQYTQSDLEHLQLISALIATGSRIGEIAQSERKTLEALLRKHAKPSSKPLLNQKPKVLFVGETLCDWLEDHQGCLANVDAQLVRALVQFEECSATCSVENWRDAAVHSSIYAYTGQARWLMESALTAALEERQQEFAIAMEQLSQ